MGLSRQSPNFLAAVKLLFSIYTPDAAFIVFEFRPLPRLLLRLLRRRKRLRPLPLPQHRRLRLVV